MHAIRVRNGLLLPGDDAIGVGAAAGWHSRVAGTDDAFWLSAPL